MGGNDFISNDVVDINYWYRVQGTYIVETHIAPADKPPTDESNWIHSTVDIRFGDGWGVQYIDGEWVPNPAPPVIPPWTPSEADILAQQKAEARWKLQELDAKSIRALREIALGQADSVTYLQQYDSLAAEYRALLAQEIPLPEDTLVGGNDA